MTKKVDVAQNVNLKSLEVIGMTTKEIRKEIENLRVILLLSSGAEKLKTEIELVN